MKRFSGLFLLFLLPFSRGAAASREKVTLSVEGIREEVNKAKFYNGRFTLKSWERKSYTYPSYIDKLYIDKNVPLNDLGHCLDNQFRNWSDLYTPYDPSKGGIGICKKTFNEYKDKGLSTIEQMAKDVYKNQEIKDVSFCNRENLCSILNEGPSNYLIFQHQEEENVSYPILLKINKNTSPLLTLDDENKPYLSFTLVDGQTTPGGAAIVLEESITLRITDGDMSYTDNDLILRRYPLKDILPSIGDGEETVQLSKKGYDGIKKSREEEEEVEDEKDILKELFFSEKKPKQLLSYSWSHDLVFSQENVEFCFSLIVQIRRYLEELPKEHAFDSSKEDSIPVTLFINPKFRIKPVPPLLALLLSATILYYFWDAYPAEEKQEAEEKYKEMQPS